VRRGIGQVGKKAGGGRRKGGLEVSLDRKDVRLKISAAAHRELVACADLQEKDISEFASLLLERALLGEAHVARLHAERVARWGRSGSPGENPGLPGKGPLSRIK
jgi:hypothetical protein